MNNLKGGVGQASCPPFAHIRQPEFRRARCPTYLIFQRARRRRRGGGRASHSRTQGGGRPCSCGTVPSRKPHPMLERCGVKPTLLDFT